MKKENVGETIVGLECGSSNGILTSRKISDKNSIPTKKKIK